MKIVSILIISLIGFTVWTGLKTAAEFGYYSGQQDAMLGDVRIQRRPDGKFEWIRSPWDGGMKAMDISKLRVKPTIKEGQ